MMPPVRKVGIASQVTVDYYTEWVRHPSTRHKRRPNQLTIEYGSWHAVSFQTSRVRMIYYKVYIFQGREPTADYADLRMQKSDRVHSSRSKSMGRILLAWRAGM